MTQQGGSVTTKGVGGSERVLEPPVRGLPSAIRCYTWGVAAIGDRSLLEAVEGRPELSRLNAEWVGGRQGQPAYLLRPNRVTFQGYKTECEWLNLPFACAQDQEFFLIIRSVPSARFRLNGRSHEAEESDLGHRVWYAMPLPLTVSGGGRDAVLDVFRGKYRWTCQFSTELGQNSKLTRWTLSTCLFSVGS